MRQPLGQIPTGHYYNKMRKYQYYNTNDDDDRDIYLANWGAQTFTPAVDHVIGKVKLKLFRVGDPGTITVSIKPTSGGKPVGADLCSGIILGTDITLDSNGDWYEISFGDGFDLDIGAQYAIVVRAPSGDASNKVSWRADITSPTFTGGTFVSSSDSGVDWSLVSGVDCMFEEWGVGPASPTTIVWGNLFKSQISAEKIETAILRLIQAHEDDPDAHIETGESLQSHKASVVIDHIVDSIIADKIKDWEVVNLGGAFNRTDFHWWTVFESLDGFYKSVGGTGSVVIGTAYVELATGGDAASNANLADEIGISNIFTWDKKRKIRTRIWFSDNTSQVVSISTGLPESVPNYPFLRFRIDNAAVKGIICDGTTQTILDLNFNISGNTAYDFEIRYFPGEKVEFYINDVLKGTISDDLPSGVSEAGILMYIRIGNDGAVEREIRLSYFDFWQEGA